MAKQLYDSKKLMLKKQPKAITWQSSCMIANNAQKIAKATYLFKAMILKFFITCKKIETIIPL